MSELLTGHRGKIVGAVVVVLLVAVFVAGRGHGPSKTTVDRAADTASAGLAANRAAAEGAAAEVLLRSASAAMETMFAERQTFAGAVTALPGIEPNIVWLDGRVADASRNEVAVAVDGPAAYTLTTAGTGGATYVYARDATGAVSRTCGPGCTW